MEFEVRNDGNKADRFNITLVVPEGMIADAAWQVSSWIAPGASENVSVSFSFISGTEGELQLGVTATSQNDPTISSTGNALYRVGSPELAADSLCDSPRNRNRRCGPFHGTHGA